MNVGTEAGFCRNSANIWQVVGIIMMIFKIVIPLLLIILGIIDLGKAVVASKDDEIKKALKQLMIRFIAAAAIFFIPNIVSIIMGIVPLFSDSKVGVEKDWKICRSCITDPTNGQCKGYADSANRLND